MPLMQRNEKGVFVDVSGIPVPKPQPSKVEPVKEVTYEVETVVKPLTEEGIAELVDETGVDDVPIPTGIDFLEAPDGRYGIEKIRSWLVDAGYPPEDSATKEILLGRIDVLRREQQGELT